MKVVFISNYLNHHQIPFSNAMYRILDGNYVFIQTMPMEEERISGGWAFEDSKYPYLKKSYIQYEQCMKEIIESDIAIIGSAEDDFIEHRFKDKKIVIRYSERIYKNGIWHVFSPKGFLNLHKKHGRAKARNMYMLCASGYAAGDWAMQRLYGNRMYKWGYFPAFVEQELEELMKRKQENAKCEIVWCGRFIPWKHPETVLQLAKSLKRGNFHITMIGTGELRQEYEALLEKEDLQRKISIIGPLKPEKVRDYMERANIFLTTSDYNEGWGAVVNEAMNSGCAVVVSHALGCVPFLIEDGVNGIIYKSRKNCQLYDIINQLISDREQRERLGRKAYGTIRDMWNADCAASNALKLFSALLKGENIEIDAGPCSKAEPVLQWNMYRYMTRKRSKYIDE